MKLYDELATYAGRPLGLVRLRCQYAAYELAWLWSNRKGNYEGFYKESDLYLYDLTEYQTRLHAAGWHEWLASIIKKHNVQSILDFGGGLGEASITAWDAGVRHIDFVEIMSSPQYDYAARRFLDRGMDIHIFTERWSPSRSYDLIIAMDVLEHMEHPQQQIRQFHEMASLLVANCDNLPFGEVFPQHISKPDLTALYHQVEGNLWAARR